MDPRFAALIEKLAAPVSVIRDQARAALVAAGAEAAEALTAALSHPERDVRAGAALALGEIKHAGAAGALARVSREDPDPGVRPLALRALAALAGPGCTEAVRAGLLGSLASDDAFARALACRGLARIGDEASRRAVEGALQDPEQWVRDAAREALGGPRTPSPAPGAAPQQLPAQVAPQQALAGLASLDTGVQQRTQRALIARGPAAIDELEPLLLSGPQNARRAAAEVLGAIGDPAGLPPLHKLLVQADLADSLRAVALHCMAAILARAGTPQAAFPADLAWQHLRQEDPFVRAAAAAALVAGGRGEVWLRVLEALEQEEEPWVVSQALAGLARRAGPGDRAAIPALVRLLGAVTEVQDQKRLLQALDRILEGPGDPARQVVGAVSFFLDSQRPEVRLQAGRLLARVAPSLDPVQLGALAALVEGQQGAGDPTMIRGLARLAPAGEPLVVPPLRRVLGGGDAAAAREAARALARVGGKQALEALVQVANSRAGAAVAAAAQALTGLAPRSRWTAVRGGDGRWQLESRLWCDCGGQLRWVDRDRRRELRCPECDAEYVLSQKERLFAVDATAFGVCLCPGCERKQPLVRQGDSDVLVCPESGQVHVRPFDHPLQLRLLESLPLGACACCSEPQPLIRVDDQVLCYRSRRAYRAADRGFELADRPPEQVDEVAAINRALLMGSLDIAQSGMARAGDPDEEEP
jgi:HEAT repeat protein